MAEIEYKAGVLDSPFTTMGHVKGTAFDSRVFYKPSINKLVIRTKGVLRRSKAVVDRNNKVASVKPAKACKGLPMAKFRKCLREQMKKI